LHWYHAQRRQSELIFGLVQVADGLLLRSIHGVLGGPLTGRDMFNGLVDRATTLAAPAFNSCGRFNLTAEPRPSLLAMPLSPAELR
jgi:hypothetical protein